MIIAMTIHHMLAANSTPGALVPSSETLLRAIEHAIRAPSGHNLQPWRFRVGSAFIDLIADRTKSLPVLDPDDRELVMSCGAAIFHLRIALRHAGYGVRVVPLPDPDDPDAMARLYAARGARPTVEEAQLFDAIGRRHTIRTGFLPRPFDADIAPLLEAAAAAEGAEFRSILQPVDRTELIDLVAAGARAQAGSSPFRREMAGWLHPAATVDDATEGVVNFPNDVGGLLTYYGPLGSDAADAGEHFAAHLRSLAEAAPLLAVLGTDRDGVSEWLEAGQALAHVLLLAAVQGIQAAVLNTPVQTVSLREKVGQLAGKPLCPQLVLAFGYAPTIHATPRRPVADFLM